MNYRTFGMLFTLSVNLLFMGATGFAAVEMDSSVAGAAQYEAGASMASFRQLEILMRQAAGQPEIKAELEQALAKLLAPDTTYEAKHFACKQLAIIGAEASLPAIEKLLQEPATVGIACLALGTNPSSKVVEMLRRALPASQGMAQVQIINFLANRKDHPSAKVFESLIQSQDLAVANAAIAALGRIASVESCRTLSELLRNSNPAQLPVAVEASLQAAGTLVLEGELQRAAAIYEPLLANRFSLSTRRAALSGLFRCDEDGGEQRILEALQSLEPQLKPVAIAAIPSLKNSRVSARFAAELPQLATQEQALLVMALADRGDKPARTAILQQAESANPIVRRVALRAIAEFGDASVVPLLAGWVANAPQAEDRKLAEQVLVRLDEQKKINRAILVELGKVPGQARAQLINILAQRGSTEAIPVLLNETSNPETAAAAFQALSKLAGPDQLPALVNKLVDLQVAGARPAAEGAVVQVMLQLDAGPARSEAVRKALAEDPAVETRRSLLRLLPVSGDAEALAVLQSAGQAADASVKDTAIRALADWPNPAAWNELLRLYQQSENETHRVLALRALVRLAAEENAQLTAVSMQHYQQLLSGARNDNDRKLILGALGGAATLEALQLALPLLEDAGVRAEAELAVKTIANAIKPQHPQAAQEALEKLKP